MAKDRGFFRAGSGVLAVMAFPFFCLLILTGCGSRTEYLASDLSLERSGWDTVYVDVSFARRTVIGGSTPLRPDSVVVTLFDAQYETVYSGPRGGIPIPDRRLGDRERLTIEICGTVRSRQICVQDMLHASPKRLQVDEEIVYPDGSDLAEGSYEFSFDVERKEFDGEGWERIDPEAVNGHLLVWVDDGEAREKGKVQVPFTSPRGNFDLSRYANYKDFRFYLDSELLDQETASVHFEIFAGLSGTPTRLASVRKEVQQKTEGERSDDVRYFVEQATEMLIDELGSFLGGRRAMAYVEEWRFNQLSQQYQIAMEIEWDGPIFDRGHYELQGDLEVGADGSRARFDIRGGNRRAVRRWRTRTDGRSLRLGDLEPRRRGGRTTPL